MIKIEYKKRDEIKLNQILSDKENFFGFFTWKFHQHTLLREKRRKSFNSRKHEEKMVKKTRKISIFYE